MMKAILFLGVICLTIMFGLKLSGRQLNESLATESNETAAATLPLDKKTSTIDYETATFGIG